MTEQACYGCDYLYMENEVKPICTKICKKLSDITNTRCIEHKNRPYWYKKRKRKVKIQD